MPTGQVRYDNLKAAVAQVLGFNRARVETERWTAFQTQRGLAHLPPDPRPLPSVAAYDQLLRHHRATTAEGTPP